MDTKQEIKKSPVFMRLNVRLIHAEQHNIAITVLYFISSAYLPRFSLRFSSKLPLVYLLNAEVCVV